MVALPHHPHSPDLVTAKTRATPLAGTGRLVRCLQAKVEDTRGLQARPAPPSLYGLSRVLRGAVQLPPKGGPAFWEWGAGTW
jgi:hypothetical protein